MTAAELDIIIGANVTQAVAAFEKVEKELEQTGKTALETSKEIGYIPKSFDEVSASVNQIAADFHNKWDKIVDDAQRLPPVIEKNTKEINLLEKQVQKFGGGVAAWNKFTPAVTTAGTAVKKAGKDFTDLSRVIQDLPFGIQGIQNNLTQLIPAAAGAGLAFSAIVSAITFAQVGLSYWYRGTKKAKEGTDEFAKSLNSAKAGAIETGVKLQAFVNIAKDNTKSLSERNYALDQANKLMGEHGEKLTLANVATKEITEQTQKFTQALIAEAVASKYSDKIADLIIKQAEASKAYGDELDKYNKVAKQTADINKNTFSGGTGGVGGLGNVGAINKARSAFNDVVTAASNYKTITKDLSETNALFNETIQKSVSLFGEIGTKTDDNTNKVKDNTKAWEAWKAQMMKLNTQGIVLGSFQQEVQKLVGDQGKLTITPSVKVKPFELTDLEKQAAAVAATINGVISNAAASVGEAIGNIFSGQSNPFASFLGVLGEGLKTLGKQLIEIGLLAEAVQTALKSLIKNPYLTIAAGIAAVALGQILSNKAKNIKAFATGGVVTQPTLALIGEQGPERITPLGYEGSANNVMKGEVVFQISGQNLRGILRRADNTAFYTT